MGEKNKNRKQGRIRKSAQNLRYINERCHEKSHVRRITKHLDKFPDDKAAQGALAHFKLAAGYMSTRPKEG